jgi:hypothetical protein
MGRPNSLFAWNLKPIAQIMAIHLPLVCHQIRFEVGKYFAFDFNSFGSTMPQYFTLLTSKLTAEQKSRIEIVTINYARQDSIGMRSSDLAHYLHLCEMSNLKLLVLRDMNNMKGAQEVETRQEFRDSSSKKDLNIDIVKICWMGVCKKGRTGARTFEDHTAMAHWEFGYSLLPRSERLLFLVLS